ncbi:MAG: RagB/SusD family nutrient uptake outer membrane protein [Chitinophagaceae bacterium]|nr:RagB/SusD family nutrient uptake outer membrane protein [Chitinophagaceae bacterium]
MKKLFILPVVSVCIALSGCKKYLEKEPDNRAKLTSPAKVSQLLASAYPLASYLAFSETMSDNVSDKGSGEIVETFRNPYYFENVQTPRQDSPDYFWNACYEAIAAANQALEACNTADDPEQYRAQKGEALVARAYAHFMLAVFYAKPYNESTAAASAGIPYVTEPETVVIKKYERKTVAYVYEMVEKDLLEGLSLLDGAAYTAPRYHFNGTAANAFATRFYLYKKDYAKTVQYATAAVPDLLPNLRAWNTTYQTYGINNLPAEYQKTSESANLLLVTCPSTYTYGLLNARSRYGVTQSKINEILNTSIEVTGGSWSFIRGTVGAQDNVAIPKFNYLDFVEDYPGADYGLPYGTVCLFSAEEVLFNKAEANVYLGNTAAAIADLNTYMSTRITGATPGNLAANRRITETRVRQHYGNAYAIKEALILYILELKRAEFLHEGMRWMDMLRYDMPVTHEFVGPGNAPVGSITIEPDDKLRQLKLPDGVKLSGIEDLNR